MERMIQRYDVLMLALSTLDKGLVRFEKLQPGQELYAELRDSVIKRFEYSVDIFWKCLKDYLAEHHGVQAVSSPKGIFKLCLDVKLISDAEYAECVGMIEHLAEQMAPLLPTYHTLMQAIAARLKSRK